MTAAAAAITKTRGFEGVIHGATLSDLIQMECLAMTTRAVRVDRHETFGRIFFAGGQVVHAEMEDLRGECALFELVQWPDGSFTIEDGVRSIEETITRDWHSLLIEAAQRADESNIGNPTALPQSALPVSSMPKFNPVTLRDVFADPEITSAIHFCEDGTLLESRSESPDDLQATFAYIVQLSSLIGESLGAEGLSEIQITGNDYKAVCAVRDSETVAILAGGKTNLPNVLKKLD